MKVPITMDGTLTMMSASTLMTLAIFCAPGIFGQERAAQHADGNADQRGAERDQQLPDKGVSEPSAFHARGHRVVEEKADVESADAVDQNIAQDEDKPEQADRGGEAAQG